MAAIAVGRAVPSCCRLFFVPASRQIAKPSSLVTRRFPSCLGVSQRPSVTPCQTHFRRCLATFSGAEDHGPRVADEELQKWLDEAKTKSWLWRWLHDVDELEKTLMTEQEYNEREKLVEKLMDRYFDTPDAKFDLDIFEEGIDLCIKYNDRHGVGTFWRLMEEMNVEPPDELREKVETFQVKSREASWYE
ncbi:hypothetical protein OS493_023759 [Desmophyllum pertusum]|uniref:Uncharacterized protein n=1 Tax=Desmophyllum pertusum TaxID=174260 RepID=A0A9X0CJS4_9CNID|nr:hypothetical protein OS493_023759 [Desmophyllum pertusum]